MKRGWQFLLIGAIFTQCSDSIDFAQDAEFQLAPPQVETDSVFFKTKATLQVRFEEKGAEVRYSLGDQEVDQQGILASEKLTFDTSQSIRLRAFHPSFAESEEVHLQVFQVNKDHASAEIVLSQNPSESYAGKGKASLLDLSKGTLNFRSGNEWLGFQTDSLVVTLDLSAFEEVNALVLSCLSDPASWVFGPKAIALFQSDKLIEKRLISTEEEHTPAHFEYFEVPIVPSEETTWQVVVYPLDSLPSWHPGAGQQSWLFLDEVVIQ